MIIHILPTTSSHVPPRVEGEKRLMREADDVSGLIPQEDEQLQYVAGLSWSWSNPAITSTFSTLVVPLCLKKYLLSRRQMCLENK